MIPNYSAYRFFCFGMRLVLLAAILVLADFRLKELGKEFAGILPVFTHYAVFYFWGFNLPLYKSCILQFLKMLAHRGLCYGQFLMNVAEIASLLFGEEFHDGNTGRMSQSLGKPCQCFSLDTICFLFSHNQQ